MILSRIVVLLFASLLLITLFENASACGQRRSHRRRHHYHIYPTTTESYQKRRGKRSIDDNEFNEAGANGVENVRTNCGKTLCPKATNYPTDEIIDAVDRFHQYLRNIKETLEIESFDKNGYFFTSDVSKTLSRRPHDHWYLTDFGCKQHATVNFPQEGYSHSDERTYYVVNVPNLRQGIVERRCTKNNGDQICSKDKDAGAAGRTRTCQQKYANKEFLVLPTNKRHFDVKDFEVKSFNVPESCHCMSSLF